MPWKPAIRAAYLRAFRAERKHRAIIILGGECAVCNYEYDWQSRSNIADFEFDHLPGEEKLAPVARLWDCRVERLMNELMKCQLACVECHKDLTRARRELMHSPVLNGIILEEEVPF